LRVWDTYLCEGEKFSTLHLYVCCALMCHFTDTIMELNSQDLICFLKNLPPKKWRRENTESIISQAYVWKIQFDDAPNHLHSKVIKETIK